MKPFGRHAIVGLFLAIIAAAALALASCSGHGAADDNNNDSGSDAAKATLNITATLDGRDATAESGGMIADADGNFAGALETGSDGLGATLAPGKYKILVTFQGDYEGAVPPMQVLEVELRAGQTTRKQITLDKNVSMSALQFLQQLTLKAVRQAAAGNAMGLGGAREADTSRLGKFAACAGLPDDYFGDAGDIPSDQLNAKPKLQFTTPQSVAMPSPPHATPMQTAFDTMWVRNLEAAVTAEDVETTMTGLRVAIVWGDMDGAGKLVAHLSDLLSRMAAAGKASRLAEAKLLRLEVAPLMKNNPPPVLDVDDPVGMQQAFIAWQQKIKQDGLSSETVAKLKGAGWTDKDIAGMTASAIRAPAGQVMSQTIVGAALAVATIRRDEQGDGKRAAAANAELEKLRKGVTRCGSL